MATAAIYCTHKELKRVFPQLDSFDGKKSIYGWTLGLNNWRDTDLDIYYSNNTGLVSQLYWDGAEVDKIAFNTTETTKLDGAFNSDANVFYVDASHGLAANDIVKIDNEYIRIVGIDSDTMS